MHEAVRLATLFLFPASVVRALVAVAFLVVLQIVSFVVVAHYSSMCSGFGDRANMMASWCCRGPFHFLHRYFEIMSKTCSVTITLVFGPSFHQVSHALHVCDDIDSV